jgi:tetratricopeptide (TPR) repeat protein
MGRSFYPNPNRDRNRNRPSDQLALGVFVFLSVRTVLAHGESTQAHSAETSRTVPLIQDLFALDFPITTDNQQAQNYFNQALAHFRRGVVLEEGLFFDEPPSWYYPVRQSLGTLLLDLGRFEEAGAVFRKDLLKNSENPWSLFGLARSLEALGKTDQAADAEKRFRRAWGRADLELKRPVF